MMQWEDPEEEEEDHLQLYELEFPDLVAHLKNNPYEYEFGATRNMAIRNGGHCWPFFSKIFFAYVQNLQTKEEELINILPGNHPYFFKQNQLNPTLLYQARPDGYVYIIRK